MDALIRRLRTASPGALWLSSGMAMAFAVALDRTDPRASFLTGVLVGLSVGLGVLALGAWQRRTLGR